MFSNSFDPHSSNHNGVLANMYFYIESKNAEGKIKCRKCEAMCKDNSGHGNLVSHIKTKHASCWQEELKQHLQGATRGSSGSMDSFVSITKVVSDEAKNINSWIEWIVLADLPITVVENEHYRKNSTLKPTTYKSITKYMTSLLEIVKMNIKRGLPKTFGLIFDGTRSVYDSPKHLDI
jgi:hypothetical protein